MGAFCGEWLPDEHDSVYYIAGSKIYDNSPGFADFLRKQMGESGEILSDRVTFDAKKMVSVAEQGRHTSKYLNNLKGAYAEDLARAEFVTDGVHVIKDISHINSAGPDLVRSIGHYDDVMESKYVQSLTVSQLNKYLIVDEITGKMMFNANYIGMHGGEKIFTESTNQKRFILFLNGPESTNIMNRLKLKLPERVPYEYKNPDTGEKVSGAIEIVIKAVNK